ncbi:protein kinase domain-containing protein [Hyalangium gracile]|uniref:protein kinase domain-containing protein n=1 Tax=Hyalangium gracile TaxID=394092 RepID=UPI001CD037FA|nr:serine/threonine-protein kinase [Hyalangium gracile]
MSLENYGKYQLLKRLAMGGMAQIYLARRKAPEASDELVVIKRILPHLAENVEFIRMFLDEAKIAARLAHPNIVAIHDLGAQDDSFFLAMEYIHGEDVRRMWKRAASQGLEVPVPLAVRIIIEACAGLDYAHKKTDPSGKPLGIVHRDVSPQNILVSFEGVVKVVDFGIAKAADQATVTRSGVLKGKYSYMSPEQAAGKRVDCRSDVFALGVVLYELVTNTRLFKRSSDMQTLSAVAECHVIPPSQANPRVPADLDPIILKALAREPDARYSEALQLQLALEQWLIAHQFSASPAELSTFLSQVYADRLAREARSGTIVVEEDPPLTGQRTAVEGHRRSGVNPSVAPKKEAEVTRADRGELIAAAAAETVEVTDPSPPRASRTTRSVESRREQESDRQRVERRPPPPRPIPPEPPRSQGFEELPTEALDGASLARHGVPPLQDGASLVTGTTQAPRRGRIRRRWAMAGAAAVSALVVALLMWIILSPSSSSEPAVVRLETVPPGARVLFEGKPLPGVTPLTLPTMAAGTYKVVVSREGYQELHAAVAIPSTGKVTLEALNLIALTPREPAPPVVTPTPPVKTPPAPPAPTVVKLTLETEPAQATIFVNGQERGAAPQVVEAKAEEELEVKVSAPEYKALSRKVRVGAGPAQVEHLVLEPLPKAPSTPPIKQTRVPEPPKPAPEPVKAMVRFAVTPWAEVTCGGRNLGTTPFEAVSLPVGVYQCKFYNPDLGRTLTQKIEVKATGMNKVVVKF